jgi:hypothetical protein
MHSIEFLFLIYSYIPAILSISCCGRDHGGPEPPTDRQYQYHQEQFVGAVYQDRGDEAILQHNQEQKHPYRSEEQPAHVAGDRKETPLKVEKGGHDDRSANDPGPSLVKKKLFLFFS